MSTPLILDSLEIESFRAFKHLRIDRLGRVNLVTGRNNVGKSYLLEALWVYAHRGSAWEILQLMQQRDEVQLGGYFGLQGEEIDLDEQISNIRHIFYGRKDVQEHASPIKIGAIHKPHASLLIEVGSLSSTGTGEPGQRQLQLFEPGMYGVENQLLTLVAQIGMEEPEYYPLNRYFGRRLPQVRDKKKPIPSTFIRANGLDPKEVGLLWDSIALTDLEPDVLGALRIIAPGIERVTFVAEPGSRSTRTPIVRTPQFDAPIPLRSMGEGMTRLLGIALSLVNARNGILLIDEIESGLHYSVQPDLWRLIFRVANRLNIQVFATTHSWDNIAAFQQAAQEDHESEGMLISLRRNRDEPERVAAVLFDEKELATINRENIEVR